MNKIYQKKKLILFTYVPRLCPRVPIGITFTRLEDEITVEYIHKQLNIFLKYVYLSSIQYRHTNFKEKRSERCHIYL